MSPFWMTSENIPQGMGFALYGREHLIWLGAIAACVAALCAISRRADHERRRRLCIALTSVTLAYQIIGDIVLIATGQYAVNYLPLDLCGLAIFAEFACALRPSPLLKELVYCLFMPGALAALAFSDWVVLPPWNFFAVRSFVIHGLLTAYPLMLLAGGEFRPDIKKLPKCFGIGLLMCVPIYIIDKALDQNFFFLNWPSPGSPLVMFEELLGNPGYQIGLPLMLWAVWLVIYLPQIIGLFRKR